MLSTTVMPIAPAGGVVYLLMALTMTTMLGRVPHARVAQLWLAGAVLCGITVLLTATPAAMPLFMGYELVGLIGSGALLLQTASLRTLRGCSPLPQGVVPLAMVLLAAGASASLLDERRALVVVMALGLAAFDGLLAWQALQAARQWQSRSAALIAVSQLLLALALVLRAASLVTGAESYVHEDGGPSFLVLHAVAVLGALYGSLGFMGLMLDLSRRAERQAREEQVVEAVRREAAEHAAQDLRDLLQQRDTLSAERERLLQVLAHEIRQPLHNAGGALQALGQALGAGSEPRLDRASLSLQRAEAVLAEVRSVLDNTLAAATLLSRSAPLAMQDVDLDFLVELVLGDLDDSQRARVQVQWCTDQRQAELEPGLLRLALRNLLLNAFAHGGPGVTVLLQIDEQLQPPALLLRVIDDGPGLAPHGSAGDGRGGLGLGIVTQVMRLHGGRLDLLPQAPRGLQAVLVLPLPPD